MRKIICLLLMIVMMPITVSAESVDLENLNLEELQALNQRTEALLRDAILQKTRDDMQAFTTENGLVMADNGEEVMVRAYNGSDKEVIIPAEYNGLPVTRIGEQAFSQNDQITSVLLPSTVTVIGESAFWCCKNLSNINLEYVSEIRDDAFYKTALKGVLILRAESVVVGDQAFRYTQFSGIRIYAKKVQLNGIYNFINMNELEYIFFDRDCVIKNNRLKRVSYRL